MAALMGEQPLRGSMQIIGDFGTGAYGPTIILKLLSEDAALWLCRLFIDLATTRTIATLTDEPTVSIRGLRRLVLERRDPPLVPGLHLMAPEEFSWSASADGWISSAGLIQPFTEGRTGHQYLTTEGVDDALVEVSFGEPGVHVPGVERSE